MSDGDFGLPDLQLAAVDTDTGAFVAQWQRWATRISQLSAERKIATVSPGASPYTYTATTIGNLLITGGTVSAVSLVRGATSIPIPTSGFIPMAGKDAVVITYTVAPTLKFVPSARA